MNSNLLGIALLIHTIHVIVHLIKVFGELVNLTVNILRACVASLATLFLLVMNGINLN